MYVLEKNYSILQFYLSEVTPVLPSEQPGFEGGYHTGKLSAHPRPPSDVFECNDTYMDLLCGGAEDRRGAVWMYLIATSSFLLAIMWYVGSGRFYAATGAGNLFSDNGFWLNMTLVALGAFTLLCSSIFFLDEARLEAFTTRHLMVRFNRKTGQVHLHRPLNCGGIVTLPWSATMPFDKHATDEHVERCDGRFGLMWPAQLTGLPYHDMVLFGPQHDETIGPDSWAFIRRYMEKGPAAIPVPKLRSQGASWSRAFAGHWRDLRAIADEHSWPGKCVVLLSVPKHLLWGFFHWFSLLLCWRPQWPQPIRDAGKPGMPIPPLTTIADLPPHLQRLELLQRLR